jgi:hypothetical protein
MKPPNGLHPTRLSPLEIGGHTCFQGVLLRRLFPAPAARVKPEPLGGLTRQYLGYSLRHS